MQTEALPASSRRGEELRYVTEHFRDLQGLRLAPVWASLLALCAIDMARPLLVHGHLPDITLAMVLLNIGWLFWSGRWYRNRYGTVTNPNRPMPSGILSITNPEIQPRTTGNWYLVYVLLLGLYVLPLLMRRFNNIHGGEFGILAITFILLPRCVYPVPANGLILLRRWSSIAASIAMCGMYLDYLFGWLGSRPYLTATCAILLLLSLYDHWLLTRLLSGGVSAGVSHE